MPDPNVDCGGEQNMLVQVADGVTPAKLLEPIGHPAGGMAGGFAEGNVLAWSEVVPSSCNLDNAAVFAGAMGEQPTVFKWSMDNHEDVVFGTLGDGGGFLVATAEDEFGASWDIALVGWDGTKTPLYLALPGTDASTASSRVGTGGRFFFDSDGAVLELNLNGAAPRAPSCPEVDGAAPRLVDVYVP